MKKLYFDKKKNTDNLEIFLIHLFIQKICILHYTLLIPNKIVYKTFSYFHK